MRKYLSVLRLGWLQTIEYRADFAVSILGWGIRIVVSYFLWLAVVQARGGNEVGGYSFQSIIQYFLIVQIISSFIFSRVGFEINQDISKGDFINFLVKPLNYIFFRAVHEISENTFRTFLGILIFGAVLFLFFGGIPLPFIKLPILAISILASYLINFCLVSIIALSSFWFTNTSRLLFLYFSILITLSGSIFPLDLFPEKLFSVINFLPFPYIFFYPAKIVQNPVLDQFAFKILAIQWMYVAALSLILLAVYKSGVKRFEAVGR